MALIVYDNTLAFVAGGGKLSEDWGDLSFVNCVDAVWLRKKTGIQSQGIRLCNTSFVGFFLKSLFAKIVRASNWKTFRMVKPHDNRTRSHRSRYALAVYVLCSTITSPKARVDNVVSEARLTHSSVSCQMPHCDDRRDDDRESERARGSAQTDVIGGRRTSMLHAVLIRQMA